MFFINSFSFLMNYLLIFLSMLVSLLTFLFALLCKRKEYFLPLSVGLRAVLVFTLFLTERVTVKEVISVYPLLVGTQALLQFLLILAIDAQARRAEKKRKLQEEGRALLFTLPDKENSFVRERLQSTLSENKGREDTLSTADLQLEYMRKSVGKLKRAKLSPADRLAVENYSRILTAYATKENISSQELYGLNDTFSALLKLSAKYAV